MLRTYIPVLHARAYSKMLRLSIYYCCRLLCLESRCKCLTASESPSGLSADQGQSHCSSRQPTKGSRPLCAETRSLRSTSLIYQYGSVTVLSMYTAHAPDRSTTDVQLWTISSTAFRARIYRHPCAGYRPSGGISILQAHASYTDAGSLQTGSSADTSGEGNYLPSCRKRLVSAFYVSLDSTSGSSSGPSQPSILYEESFRGAAASTDSSSLQRSAYELSAPEIYLRRGVTNDAD